MALPGCASLCYSHNVAQTGTLAILHSVDLAVTTPWQTVVEAYLAGAIDSDNTRRAYRRHLVLCFTYLSVETVAEVNGAQLTSYRASVTTSSVSPNTQAQVLAAVRSFLTWSRTMGAHGLSSDVIDAALRTPRATVRRPYTVLAESEVATVLHAAENPRDIALLAVFLGAGLRVSEASGLDVSDVVVDQEGETARWVRKAKGRKDRIVPVQPEVAGAIRAYLAATGRVLGGPGPLFRAHDRAAAKLQRDRLTARAIADVVAKCVDLANVQAKHCSPHTMRHTYAIRALRHGANLIAVSKLLGHASVTTTQRYLDHLELGELRAAVPHLPIAGNTHSQKPEALDVEAYQVTGGPVVDNL